MKMPLGTKVGLGPGHIVLHGDPPPPKGAQSQFSAHVYCGQTVAQLLLSTCYRAATVHGKAVQDRQQQGKGKVGRTRNPAIAEGPRDAGVPVEIW